MESIQIRIIDKVSKTEIPEPVYYMGEWYRDWRAYEDSICMDEVEYEIQVIIGAIDEV